MQAASRAGRAWRALRDWSRDRFAERLWPTVLLFFVLASAATLTSSPGYYVGDNRFEQFWNPARRVAKSFTIWDGSRGMGRVREDFWPGTTVPVAMLRSLGASPVVAEHLWHALVLTMAGVGMVLVVRLFRPRIGLEHVIAGAIAAFGSYSATFLVPSNLYFQYALAPWLFVIVHRGLHSDRPWRWAALFALATLASGNVDTPGLLYNCVPLVPLVVFVVFVDRSATAPHVLGWFARAGVLAVAANAVVLVKTYFAAAALGQRLNDTEAADVAAQTSSWSESLRGLGNWLSYFKEGPNLLKPQGEAYFTNPVVLALTFVPPCVALYMLWRSRWRVRILYLMVMLASLVVLVGAFPRGNSSPLGRQILNAYTNIKLLAAFRNTYKIGGGLVIGVAALFAYGIVSGRESLKRRGSRLAWLPVFGAFVTIAGVAYPFWTGNVYDKTKRFSDVPTYWSSAFAYLDALPDGRSLIVPQTTRTRYRWGWVGDDIFDALMKRPHAIPTGVPLSTPIAANALEAIALASSAPTYVPGALGPMARRLGITEVVVRNDVDWQAMDRPRPSAYAGLRTDADFELAATFGERGENTVDPEDASAEAKAERELPPVEVYRLRESTGNLRSTAPSPPLLVSGDAFAWPALARLGLLDGDAPIAYTGDRSGAELRASLDAGAPLVVTDANRRRLRVLLAYEPDYSYLLAAGQELDRPTQQLFKDPAAQSVAWFPDATQVAMSGTPRSVGGTQVWNRPTNAFDGDPATSWLIRRFEQPFEHVFRIDLRRPAKLSSATILLPPSTPRGGGIRKGVLRFSDRSEVPVDLSSGRADLQFAESETTWIEFETTEIGDAALNVGVAELQFPGLDLREFLQLPDDVFAQADRDPGLAEAAARAPTAYVFSRSARTTTQVPPISLLSGADTTDEETSLRRRFRTMSTHEFEYGGFLALRADTPDQVVDAIVGAGEPQFPGDLGARGAFGSHRHTGSLSGWAGFAVDGDSATSWLAPAQRGEVLTVHFPRQAVRSISLQSLNDGLSTKIKTVEVLAGGSAVTADLKLMPGCEGVVENPPPGCKRDLTVELDPAVETDRIEIRVTDIQGQESQLGPRIRIDEVEINRTPNRALPPADRIREACIDLGVRLDHDADARTEPVALPLRVQAPRDQILGGAIVPLAACDVAARAATGTGPGRTVSLSPGWHTLETPDDSPIDQLSLRTPDLARPAERPAPPTIRVVSESPTHLRLSVDANAPKSVLYLDQSFDPGWRASVNGTPIGSPQAYDAVNAWVLDESGRLDVELRYNPERLFGASLAMTIIATAACCWLVLRRPRARGTRPPPEMEAIDG